MNFKEKTKQLTSLFIEEENIWLRDSFYEFLVEHDPLSVVECDETYEQSWLQCAIMVLDEHTSKFADEIEKRFAMEYALKNKEYFKLKLLSK